MLFFCVARVPGQTTVTCIQDTLSWTAIFQTVETYPFHYIPRPGQLRHLISWLVINESRLIFGQIVKRDIPHSTTYPNAAPVEKFFSMEVLGPKSISNSAACQSNGSQNQDRQLTFHSPYRMWWPWSCDWASQGCTRAMRFDKSTWRQLTGQFSFMASIAYVDSWQI